MEKLTWGDAVQGGRPRLTEISLRRASAGAMRRLEETHRDDADGLVELHLSSRERIWGVRRGNVCHLLWWDPRHEVYPSPLRNT
jgi:hypothetical protein